MVAHNARAPRADPQGWIFAAVAPSDVEAIAAIEAECFHPDEATTADVFRTRLVQCPELFLIARDPASGAIAGFISATLADSESLTYESMFTHVVTGQLLCIHSVAVCPEYRGKGLAGRMLGAFLEKARGNRRVKRLALLAHDHLLGMYAKYGFKTRGRVDYQLGPEPFFEMVMENHPSQVVAA